MRTIDIRTTQNVTISYDLASVRDRVIAFILDLLIKGIFLGLMSFVFFLFLDSAIDYDSESRRLWMWLFGVANIFVVMFPFLIMEIKMNGQTLGKKIMKIKVVKLDGKQPVFYDYLLRWVFRLMDVYGTIGAAGTILIASTDYAQRIGDMVANTAVVKVSSRLPITLQDVLRIDNRSSYVPVYAAVKSFPEDDIVLIKQSLDRFTKYNNEAHRKVLLDICEKMKEQLGLDAIPADKVRFLRTIIKDYIVLTR